jgi:putative ABC transport system ATP-binding protein
VSPSDGPHVPAVGLEHVTRTFGAGSAEEVRALRGIDLALPPGTFVSVEGPSGCGKTTLLNLLGLLDTPTDGTVRWDGTPVGLRTDRERSRLRLERVGFIFQRFYLLPTLTAEENVELPMRALRLPRPERRRRAADLLAEVGLSERARAYPHQLSGGEEQRVAIARALANRPGLLLADEPTGELDSANARSVLDLLVRVRADRDATLVLVTHNPEVAARARRHLVLRDGAVVGDREGS